MKLFRYRDLVPSSEIYGTQNEMTSEGPILSLFLLISTALTMKEAYDDELRSNCSGFQSWTLSVVTESVENLKEGPGQSAFVARVVSKTSSGKRATQTFGVGRKLSHVDSDRWISRRGHGSATSRHQSRK
jgi:hypothetical protein